MWRRENRRPPGGGFWTPPPTWSTTKRVYSTMPMSGRRRTSSIEIQEPIHRVPYVNSPYVIAKHAQLASRDPDRAISLFWAAINAGDRVDTALKDMALVLKRLDQSDEGIEAIKSFRYLCPFETQDSIDNVLLELYKKSGRIQEQAELLEHKLKTLGKDTHLGGRITLAKRSPMKQNNTTIEKQKALILGDLAWVHLQLHNYGIAEHYYRSSLSLEPDNNKCCNLAICLIRMDRILEAKSLLEDVRQSLGNHWSKSFERATKMLAEREQALVADNSHDFKRSSFSDNCSFASWMKKKQALAGTHLEPGNMDKKKSYASSESVEQNSPGLVTQPRECKWSHEDADQRKGQVTIGAARRLRFRKTLEVRHAKSVESAASSTNGEKTGSESDDDLHIILRLT